MDSWALVSSALFCVYRPHPWPVGHPLSMNGNGEWTSACGRCDRFGEGGQDDCRGGRYGLCEGEKKSGSRNRKAESRNLKAERRKQREERREKKAERREEY